MRTTDERIRTAFDALREGLAAYLSSQMRAFYKERWVEAARESFRDRRSQEAARGEPSEWDLHALLTVMWDQWNRVFRNRLGHFERSLVSELRDFRNRWAHQEEHDFDDAYRILDSAHRLLRAIEAPEARIAEREKRELLRARFYAEARAAYRKARVRRRQMQDVFIYLTSAAAAISGMVVFIGQDAWPLAVIVGFLFAYFIYQRVASPSPLFAEAHECVSCGKIIYSEECPYCERGMRLTSDRAPPHSQPPIENRPPTPAEEAGAGKR